MSTAEKIEGRQTPEVIRPPENPAESFEINDDQKLERYQESILGDVDNRAQQTKQDSRAQLDRVAHSYELPDDEIAALRQEQGVDAQLESTGLEIEVLAQNTREQISGTREIEKDGELTEYLEKEAFGKFGVSKDSEKRALAEAPEDKREILERSFQNIRDSLATMYEIDTVEGRVDEQAYELAKRKKNADIVFPYLSSALQSFEQTLIENGIDFKITPQDLRVSSKFVDIDSLNGRFDIVGQRLLNHIEDTGGAEKVNEIFGKLGWDGLKQRALEEISERVNAQTPVSRQEFRNTISREQLTAMIDSELSAAKSTGFLNSNIKPASLRKVVASGGFRDVLAMSDGERTKLASLGRSAPSYLDHRRMSEEALGVRQTGDEVVLYGTYAHDFNDEQKYGGASQYGDIFLRFKPGTEVSFTEGDSMNPRDSVVVAKKISKALSAKGFGFNRTDEYEYAENPRSRQIAEAHAPLAKAYLVVDLKRQAAMTDTEETGRHYSYLEGQIINPTFENIDSINIPRFALENADPENAAFLDQLRNDPAWRDKIKIIES